MTLALSRMKKAELVEFLKASTEELSDELRTEVEAILDDVPNKGEVYETAQKVKTQVDDLAPIENSLKKADSDDEAEKKSGKSLKKKTKKKTKKKKKVLKPKVTQEEVELPTKLETEVGDLEVNHDIKDFDSFYEEVMENDNDNLVFATYWSKKLLKKYNYDKANISPIDVKEFDYDLDLLLPVYVGDNVAYAVSIYTDVLFIFDRDAFEIVDGIRTTGGMEWDLYEKQD